MGIFSRRHRRRTLEQSQAGAGVSSPLDLQGDGPVGLGDRTRPDAQGSPATNQGRTEPIPPTGKQADPDPDKDATSVGSAASQLPSPPGLPVDPVPAPGPPDGPRNAGAAPPDQRPVVDPPSSAGPHAHVSDTPGSARRPPLSQGESPEEQESDVTAGAAQMTVSESSALAGPDGSAAGSGGDAQGVPSLGEISSGGTSEQMAPVQGVRTALPPQPPA